MDIKALHRQGMSIRQIARLTGRSRKVVRKTLAQPAPQPYRKREPRPRKLDPFLGRLEELRRQRPHAPASWLFRQLVAAGYAGHYEAVKVWAREHREIDVARRNACVRFETDPGVEGQFDWKGPVRGLIASLPALELWFFRFVLGYSRWRYTRVVASTRLPMVLENLMDAFTAAGGAPGRLVLDNFKAAVLRPRPHLKLHPAFVAFCTHYGTEPAPALAYSPQRKGKVERSFRDLVDTGALDRTWSSVAELQAFVDAQDRLHAATLVSTTGEEPRVRLDRERPFLIPLPAVRFDPRLAESRRVLRDCTISFGGAWYSVPHTLVGQRVLVKASPDGADLEIFDRDQPVAHHPILAKGSRAIIDEHIEPLRRPRWDRLQHRADQAPARGSAPEPPRLVAWPRVEVAVRPIAEYAALVERGTR